MRLYTLVAFLFVSVLSIAQPTLYLKTGNIKNTDAEKNPTNSPNFFNDNIYNGHYYLWLQFKQVPTDNVLDNIRKTGVQLFDYLPDNTFIAAFPTAYNFNQLSNFSDYAAICKPKSAYKIDNSLYNTSSIPWAINGNNIKVDVTFINTVDKNTFTNILSNSSIVFTPFYNSNVDVVTVNTTLDEITKIAQNPLVVYVEPTGAPGKVEDINAVSAQRANFYNTSDNWSGGKKINGEGVVVAVGDDGAIGPHIDFEGRLDNVSSDFAASETHADHVAGIIAGAGNLNPAVKGQATASKLKIYDGYDPYNMFPSIYNIDSVRVVTHSLGQGCSNISYTSNARTSDILMRTYPNLMYVHSSGNSGTDPSSSCPTILSGGYRSITGGYKSGKQVTTVGNLDRFDAISSSSSRGPVSDGRIKPDICAVGSNVNSTQPNNSFAVFSGTSMSCPAIAGDYALMMHAFKLKNIVQPEGALMKAIMLNSADDLGTEGPDYVHGFGRVNVRRAIKTIDETRYLSGNIITNGSANHSIVIPANVQRVKVMVYWPDREATASAAKALVNNIDAKIIAPDLVTILPWTMDIAAGIDAGSVSSPAIKLQDSLNNVEQIQIDNPSAGTYTLNVFGKAIPNGPQKYFVTYEFYMNDEIVITYPNGGEAIVPNEATVIRWDATEGTGNFGVSYSINNGTSWVAISNSVSADRRFVNWTPPTTLASRQALIRVTRGTTTDLSDTNFVILRIPANISFSATCATSTRLSWTSTNGATEYDVFRLGEKYMELAGTTTATNLTLENQDNGVQYYYAVRAKMASKNGAGRLSNATAYTNNSTVGCPLPVKLISFQAQLKNNKVNLIWKTATEIGMFNYVVEKSTSPTFEVITTVGEIKPNNSPSEQTYTLVDAKIETNTTYYYRLKMIEQGKTTYSNVQSIKTTASNVSFSVSPNPAKDNIFIALNTGLNKNLTIRVYNELGVEMLQKQFVSTNGGDRVTLQTSTLANGNYFISLFDTKNGDLMYKQQVTIIK
jgi:hypothetical protein